MLVVLAVSFSVSRALCLPSAIMLTRPSHPVALALGLENSQLDRVEGLNVHRFQAFDRPFLGVNGAMLA